MQTLTKLNLTRNQIGDQGVFYLAQALQQNRVVIIHFRFAYYFSHILDSTQTLMTLYLAENRIGDLGAQHLGDALQKNQVQPFCLHLFTDTAHSKPFRH